METVVREYKETNGYEKVVFELTPLEGPVDLSRLARLSVKMRLLAEIDEMEYRMTLKS
ncbi:MAG: hypothetical protein ACXAE3_05485 [Candidatus Kariarchaeaceae archaeon]